jgi:hypothetical protein
MEHANAVRKTRVGCPGVDKLRKAQLLYSAQSLKGSCLDDSPKHVFKLIRTKLNQIVKRVSNSFAVSSVSRRTVDRAVASNGNRASDDDDKWTELDTQVAPDSHCGGRPEDC